MHFRCKIHLGANGRGALAENPEVARAVGERDREGTGERAAALSAGNTFLEPVLNLQISRLIREQINPIESHPR